MNSLTHIQPAAINIPETLEQILEELQLHGEQSMSDIKTGGTAFPVPMFSVGHAKYQSEQHGMTLRDFFAAKAMQGLLASDARAPRNEFAAEAYAMADAMLKARKEQK
jgi:hypothetical protein